MAKPLQYSASVTKKRVSVWILIIWLFSGIYSVVSHGVKGTEVLDRAYKCNIWGPHRAAVYQQRFFYFRLYCVVRRHRKSAAASNLDESGRLAMNAYRRERNMTKAMLVSLCLFLFCLTPWFVFYQVIGACPTCEDHKSYEMYLFAIFYYIFTMKSLLNPFLYAWRLSKFRVVFKSMLKIRRNQRIEAINSSNSS